MPADIDRSQYERDGFAVLERFVGPEVCDRLVARAGELVAVLAGMSTAARSTNVLRVETVP